MHRLLGTLAIVAFIAAPAGCSLRDGTTTQATGPSPFLAGFDVGAVVTAINGAPDGPECPATGELGRATSSVGTVEWSTGALAISCEDPGDGTATRRAWSAGVAAELARLGATVGGTGSADGVADEWFYRSGGIEGVATLSVFPGGMARSGSRFGSSNAADVWRTGRSGYAVSWTGSTSSIRMRLLIRPFDS